MAEAEKESEKKKQKLKYLQKVFQTQASTEGGEAETKLRQRQISNQSSGSGHSFRREENDFLECFGIPWRSMEQENPWSARVSSLYPE